jgi:hypothetical protein
MRWPGTTRIRHRLAITKAFHGNLGPGGFLLANMGISDAWILTAAMVPTLKNESSKSNSRNASESADRSAEFIPRVVAERGTRGINSALHPS